jgi:hypothetical protein
MRTKFWLESLNRRDQSEDLRHRREVDIKMDHRKTEWEDAQWIHVTHVGPEAGCCEHGNEFDSHKKRDISWLVEHPNGSLERPVTWSWLVVCLVTVNPTKFYIRGKTPAGVRSSVKC